ncbi:phosphomethylpyrimidine synthase ThiC, partial [bacterium]|nr:phosphomethylpyrimidine synthase ThiC [bacterium]
MTQLQSAIEGVITDAMRTVAEFEHVPPETVLAEVAAGRAV